MLNQYIDRDIIYRGLLLAWPISLQSVLVNLLSMVDVIMVSHLGDTAVGAVGLGNRYQFMLTVIVLGIAWTVGVLAAQYQGANQTEKIRSTISQGVFIATIFLIPVVFISCLHSQSIISIGSSDKDVIQQGSNYISYVVPSLFFVAITLAYDNALRALGNVKTPLVLSAIAIALNILLNFWLIHGGLGIPALGVVGAAIATCLARVLQVALVIFYLKWRQHILLFHKDDFFKLFNKTEITHFVRLAVPMIIGFALWSIGIFIYQVIYGRIGTEELAIMSMLAPIEAIFIALFFGLASACSIMVGHQLGAGKFENAIRCATSFSIFGPISSVVIAAIIIAASEWVLLPFSKLPQSTLEHAQDILILIALLTWMKVINMTIAMGVLRAGGDSKYCTYIDVFGMWIVSIPLTAFAALYLKWPLFFVVLTAYSEELIKIVLFTWRASKKVWLKNLTVHKA